MRRGAVIQRKKCASVMAPSVTGRNQQKEGGVFGSLDQQQCYNGYSVIVSDVDGKGWKMGREILIGKLNILCIVMRAENPML